MAAISANARATLLAKRNVKATYTRQDGTVVVVVSKKLPIAGLAPVDVVPRAVEGRPTDVVIWGEIRAPRDPVAAPQTFTQKMRPTPGGFSVGHKDITAGTLGIWVMKNGRPHILSNNHVLANSNEATAGDWILQPGRADGGSITDSGFFAAKLTEFVKILHEDPGNGGGELPPGCLDMIPWRPSTQGALEGDYPNLMDSGLAEEFGGTYTPEIHGFGRPVAIRDATIGEHVKKAGRTTEFTEGVVEATDLTVEVSYNYFTALFEEQLLIISAGGPFSQGGDSGSAILSYDGNALVGLLFAGGTMSDGRDVTIACKAPLVQAKHGFTL